MTEQDKIIHLEVTLRDGGYQNNWDFTQEQAGNLVSQLVGCGIDWVEIGYRNSPPKEKDPGLTGRCPNSYIKYLRERVPDAKLAVMYSPSLIGIDDIDQMADLGVAMLRCSLPNTGATEALPLIKHAYERGVVATANMTHVTEYQMDALIAEIRQIWENGCSVVYLADSNGSMTPASVRRTFGTVQKALPDVVFGFHNHNMLGMAMANAIAALEAGAVYIDSSLRGMGRSAGNVVTEYFATWRSRQAGKPHPEPEIAAVFRVANYLNGLFSTATPRPTLEDAAYGAYDFDSLLGSDITEVATEFDLAWLTLIAAMAEADLDKPSIDADTIRKVAQAVVDRQLGKS